MIIVRNKKWRIESFRSRSGPVVKLSRDEVRFSETYCKKNQDSNWTFSLAELYFPD